jgi:tryptophanyl-tRNA synthetase
MPETVMTSSRPRVLSGMRPTGKLHLGNYMGALANWVKLQDQYECYFFIADWHALTTDYADPSSLKLNTLDVALDWLAAGLDPERSTIFIQSHVPQHAELHLLFSMITPLGWLERVPTYKEQQENITGKDLSTYGFLGYPLLQAADILIYQADYVPVGQDQVAHVELTREVARRFNSMYRTKVFPEPDALLTPSPKLPGTDGRKMSKSYGNTIGLTEDEVTVTRKVSAMSTNGQRILQSEGGNPDLCPVGDLHKIFSTPDVVAEISKDCRDASSSCLNCKFKASLSICDLTRPMVERRRELEKDKSRVWEMLCEQSKRAAARAEMTMSSVREVLGTSREYREIDLNLFSASESEPGYLLANSAAYFELSPVNRSLKVRKVWVELLMTRGVFLSQAGNMIGYMPERELEEPFLTPVKKRVFITTQSYTGDDGIFTFRVPPRSYEIWVLLCLERETLILQDFVIPQKYYSAQFAQVRKTRGKDEPVQVVLRREGHLRIMDIGTTPSVDVTDLLSKYDPLN